MAAATVVSKKTETAHGIFHVSIIELSSLTSDQTEDVAHTGPSGCRAVFVLPQVTAQATDGSMVTGEHIKASDSLVNNTVRVKFRVGAGGDISGAKATVLVFHLAQASGGTSTTTY